MKLIACKEGKQKCIYVNEQNIVGLVVVSLNTRAKTVCLPCQYALLLGNAKQAVGMHGTSAYQQLVPHKESVDYSNTFLILYKLRFETGEIEMK